MNYKFTDDYQKAAFIERCAWKNFNSLYNAFPGYEQFITPYDGSDKYDVLLFKIKDGIMTDRVFVEIKVRNFIYDSYFYETKKHNSIKHIAEKELYLAKDEYKILYVNFTPAGTFIWNTNITSEIAITSQEMNKATMTSTTDKKKKTKYDMPVNRAKRYEYIWEEKQLAKHYDEYFTSKVVEKIKKNKGLNDILWN